MLSFLIAVSCRKKEREVTDFLEALWVEAWGESRVDSIWIRPCVHPESPSLKRYAHGVYD